MNEEIESAQTNDSVSSGDIMEYIVTVSGGDYGTEIEFLSETVDKIQVTMSNTENMITCMFILAFAWVVWDKIQLVAKRFTRW